MFEQETAITPVAVTQRARPPMPAWGERHLPIVLRKAFPPIQLDDARKTEVLRQIADAARHHADFRLRQPAQRRFVKMVEMRVREQYQINPRQVLDFQA